MIEWRDPLFPPHTIYKRKQSLRVINDLDNVDFIPSNVQSSHQEGFLMCLRTMKLWLRWSLREEVRQWDMFPEPTELISMGLFDRINWDHQNPNQIHWHRKTNSQTSWPREISHVMNGIHLLCLFNICHLVSAKCSEVMSKRTQKDSGEERVTAKSRPMMNLVARCGEPRYLLLHQKARGKPDMKVKLLWVRKLRSKIERWDPLYAHTPSSYSEWNVDKTWSSQEWKSGELMDDRTVRPVVCSQSGSIRYWTEAESELSLGSISFLHRVNDQVQKRQKQSS